MHNKEGVYVARGFTKNVDTLKIFSDGNYHHIIYDVKKRKLITINKGHWEYEGNRLVFNDFLYNEDDFEYYKDSVKYDKFFEIHYFSTALLSNKIIINYDLDKYYDKIEDY